MNKIKGLSIGKRDADCYDVWDGKSRIAALRSEFTTEDNGDRTALNGTWIIRWEGDGYRDTPVPMDGLKFTTVHAAFAFLCDQVLA